MKKNIVRLNKLFIIRTIFILIIICSLFSSLNALANTNPFKIINAVISDKFDGVIGDIEDFNCSEVTDNIKFYKFDDITIARAKVDDGTRNSGYFIQP